MYAPVPEQGCAGSAKYAAAGESYPCRTAYSGYWGWPVGGEDPDHEHESSGEDAVSSHCHGAVRDDKALVHQDPADGDGERDHDKQITLQGGPTGIGGATASEDNQRCAEGRAEESEPAYAVHAFAGEEGRGEGKHDRKRSDHERGVTDGGMGKSFKLQQKLEGDAEHCGDEQDDAIAGGPSHALM